MSPIHYEPIGTEVAQSYAACPDLGDEIGFPQMRGMAASFQAFAMLLLAGLVTQVAPTLGGHALALGLVQGVLCIAAFISWLVTMLFTVTQ